MTKKLINIIIVVIVMLMSINLFGYEVYGKATGEDAGIGGDKGSTVDDVIRGAQDFLEAGEDAEHQTGTDAERQAGINMTTMTISEEELKNVSNFVYNLLLAIALVVAVIVGMILGIQFMTASIEEKAKIKESLVPYVVSCVVIFGAFGIWKLAVTILSRW